MLFTKQDLENLVSSKLMAVHDRNLMYKKSIEEINILTNAIVLLETLYIDYIVTDIQPKIWFHHSDMYYVKPIEVDGFLYDICTFIGMDYISIEIEDCIGDTVFYGEYNYKTISELVSYLINSRNIIINQI